MTVWRLGIGLGLVACTTDNDGMVLPDNQAPEAVDDAIRVQQGMAITFDPTDNDRDADLDPLEVIAVGSPTSGTATLGEDLRVTYTAAGDFVGTDRFPYTVTDGRDGEATADVIVEVLPALSVTIVSPQAGEPVPAGTVTVVAEVDGCELGGTDATGCRLVGSFDGATIPSDDAEIEIETVVNGDT
ncbi:MAG: Ig-like domain-containing protein, partial [Myxococcota bacterium]